MKFTISGSGLQSVKPYNQLRLRFKPENRTENHGLDLDPLHETSEI